MWLAAGLALALALVACGNKGPLVRAPAGSHPATPAAPAIGSSAPAPASSVP
jgi:predicted small lipoprotein YifL